MIKRVAYNSSQSTHVSDATNVRNSSAKSDGVLAEATPAVSVVIAAYNCARYISQALDSVNAQTFRDYEVIVVNDGSDDWQELEDLLESHPLSITYLSQENRGVSAARNAAIKIAKGKFYAQLDADDAWKRDYLEVQLRMLADNPDVALVYPNAIIIGDSGEPGPEFMKLTPSEGEVNFETLVRQQCTVMTCVTASMSAIKEAGMFDESLRRCEDFDLWLRIVKNGGRIIYHRRILALYRRHAGSLSSNRMTMIRDLLTVFEKCSRTLNLTSGERETLEDQIAHNRAMLGLFEGKHALREGGATTALVHFNQANEYLRSPKLELVIFLLRHVPRLVVWTFVTRERLLMSWLDRQLTGPNEPHKTAIRAIDEARDSRMHF